MKHFICCVRDSASGMFMQPFCAPALGVAERMFSDSIRNAAPENVIHAHPEHFDLYKVGTFNLDTGEIVPCTPEVIVVGLQLAARKAQ